MIHKADQPYVVVNFFNADRLAGNRDTLPQALRVFLPRYDFKRALRPCDQQRAAQLDEAVNRLRLAAKPWWKL